jgi:hypothetical protein
MGTPKTKCECNPKLSHPIFAYGDKSGILRHGNGMKCEQNTQVEACYWLEKYLMLL